MKTWFQKYDSSLLVGKLGKRQNITEWILSVKGGGYPPILLKYFWQNDFPLRGAVPPNSAKNKFCQKMVICGPKATILAPLGAKKLISR